MWEISYDRDIRLIESIGKGANGMKPFHRFYLWALDMKCHMALYTVTAIFLKAIVNLLNGVFSVDILTMAEMLVVSLVFSCAETLIFPQDRQWSAGKRHIALWALLANAIYIPAALLLGWFAGVPLWGGILLILILEGVLFAMWYALLLDGRRNAS